MTEIAVTVLIAHTIFSVLALGFQQFGFMQFVRETPPYKRVEIAGWLALSFFVLSWATGFYYYAYHYEKFEKVKVLTGEYIWASDFPVQIKGVAMVFSILFSIAFIYVAKAMKAKGGQKTQVLGILVGLGALGSGALSLIVEVLMSGVVN